MDKKLPYEEPKLLTCIFANMDIITASDGNGIGEDKGENDGEWM